MSADYNIDFALEFAKELKEISIAEFFEKNKHLLGFDSKIKAMLTSVKEPVDNSLDAVEEMSKALINRGKDPIYPVIMVEIDKLDNDIYRIIVEDNGPGILKEYAPNIFGKFLYGSKFFKFIQKRGQQGIGISSVTLYAQLTTGKPIRVISKTLSMRNAYYMDIGINTKKNEPIVYKYGNYKGFKKEHGTRIEVCIEGKYISKGDKSVYEYLKRTHIANPHSTIIFIDPSEKKFVFKRAVNTYPELPKEIKPHPAGIEYGILARMIINTKRSDLISFLSRDFSGVGVNTAKEILEVAKLENKSPKELTADEIRRLLNAIRSVKVRAPPSKCLSPIGSPNIEKIMKKLFNPEFVSAVTRTPKSYRGMPFLVEVGIAYGGDIKEFKLLRYANKVPLIFDQSACVITKAAKDVNWKTYGINVEGDKPKNIILLVHVASVWVPFTSESKYAIAHYPEIYKEVKLAIQDVCRKLKLYIARKRLLELKMKKKKILEEYAKLVASSLAKILDEDETKILNKIEMLIREKIKI